MLLNVSCVTKHYPGNTRPVFQDLSMTLQAGETLALTGESGCGKSTLLHMVGGLDPFESGEITVDGTALGGLDDAGRAGLRRDRVGIVFQQFNLIPSLTVGRNLAFQARLAGRLDQSWLDNVTDRLGLSDFLDRYPEHLSGGQQQRVAIGRALAFRPALLLADEPTGNLDEQASDTVLDLMLQLVNDSGSALFLVTHSDRIANRLGRRLHLSGGTLA